MCPTSHSLIFPLNKAQTYITHTSALQLSGAHPEMGVSAYESLAAHVQAGYNEAKSASD